jgi:putative spermidine/putrescine transport system substrate-binding protein
MKTVRFVLALLALSLIAPGQSARAADVICYNCPPEWADWASMLKAIKADLKYDIPHDNKNSGQALAQILAEKSNPVGKSAGCPGALQAGELGSGSSRVERS